MSSERQLAEAGGDDRHKVIGDTGASTSSMTANGDPSDNTPIAQGSVIPPIPPLGNKLPGASPVADQGRAGDNSVRCRLKEDIEQGLVEENEALEEIDNVLWIKNLPITKKNRCKEALESWEKKDKLFTSRIDRKRKQSSDFQNEVYQQIGFYSVFQGVLLTAVAQSSLLHCNNTWTAALLSSLASFVTIIGVILKLRSIKELENTIASEESTRRDLVAWQLSLREEGQNFNFDTVKAKDQKEASKKKQRDKRSAQWLKASFVAVVIVLILFSVAFVVSIRQILCNPGRAPYG